MRVDVEGRKSRGEGGGGVMMTGVDERPDSLSMTIKGSV